MSGFAPAEAIVGTALAIGLPILLLMFGIITVRAGRRGKLASPVAHDCGWLLALGLVSLALYFLSGVYHLLSLAWASVVVLLLAAVLCGQLLRSLEARPLKILSGLLLFDMLFVAGFASFAIWNAGEALHSSGYNNPDEGAVRSALARNPNNAAAHASLAHIEQMRHDMAGAMTDWREVLRIEPSNTDALLVLGTELSNEGKVNEARPYYQRLAANDGAYSFFARRWLAKHGTH